MQKILKLLGTAMLVISLMACGSSSTPTPAPTAIPTDPPPAPTEPPPPTAAPSATNTPEPAPTAASSTNANCVNRAGNVRDATVPDNTVFKPGATFTKGWRVKNVGTCTWGAGYTLVFSLGDAMQGTSTTAIPTTAPGADAEVNVSLQASFKPGKYKGFWLLRAPDGKTFGTGSEGNIAFWVQIVVKR